MSAEIHEQHKVLERILEEGWSEVLTASRVLREGSLRFVMIAARGTSYNAALYAKYLFEVLMGLPTALASPSTFTLYESRMNLEGVLVVGISQSGESKDVLEIVRRSCELGASTLAITNNKGSTMAEAAQHHFFLRAGKEESVAATKTYTAELLVLYMFVSALKGVERLGDQLRRLPELFREVLEAEWEGIERYVVAQAFSAADLRHGPIAMIGQDFPVVVIAPPGEKAQRDLRSLVESLKDRGAEFVAVSDDSSLLKQASAKFEVPSRCPDELSPVLYAGPIQLFAENLAHLKGLDPDSPRGLSKVTETW
jgi:glucosamine--fructose-6-phosphate aminotransferase (isomerizing)